MSQNYDTVVFLLFKRLKWFRYLHYAQVNHSVHIFSVNGVGLGSKFVSGRVTGLAIAGDCLVVVDDAGDLTMSRILG